MEQAATVTFGNKPQHPVAAGGVPGREAGDDRGAVVESDPAAIMAGLRGEMDRVTRAGDSSCLCIVTPDGAANDLVVHSLGKLIASSLRAGDAVFRFADSKYLVMLRQIDRDGAVGFMKGLRERLLSASPSTAGGGKAGMTASFGGTMMDAATPLYEHMDRVSDAHARALKGKGDTICMWSSQF